MVTVLQTLLPPMFPPSYNIVSKFVWMYHEALSKHVRDSCLVNMIRFITQNTFVVDYLLQRPHFCNHNV